MLGKLTVCYGVFYRQFAERFSIGINKAYRTTVFGLQIAREFLTVRMHTIASERLVAEQFAGTERRYGDSNQGVAAFACAEIICLFPYCLKCSQLHGIVFKFLYLVGSILPAGSVLSLRFSGR